MCLNFAGKKQLKIFERTDPLYVSAAFKIVISGLAPAFIAYLSFYIKQLGLVPRVKVLSESNGIKLVAISNSEVIKVYVVKDDGTNSLGNVYAHITFYQGVSNSFTPVFTEDDLSDALDCIKY